MTNDDTVLSKRRADERRARAPSCGVMASGMCGLSTTTFVALAHAPWWIAALLTIATVVVAFVQGVFPQESGHRLEWWRDRRRSGLARRRARGRRRRLPPAQDPAGQD